jgi:phospho-N-acetylmuramoyl-pentapeptide-transferase
MDFGLEVMLNMLAPLIMALTVTAVFTWRLIPELKKLNTIQNIYEDAPDTHRAKQGTPTMGGLAIIAGILSGGAFILVKDGFSADIMALMLVCTGFGLIGFIDDFTKVAKRRNKGLSPKQKIALQIALSLGFGVYLIGFGAGGHYAANIVIPLSFDSVHLGWFALPFIVFILVAMTNAVNLTDGLDGLCAGVSGAVALFYPAFLISVALYFSGPAAVLDSVSGGVGGGGAAGAAAGGELADLFSGLGILTNGAASPLEYVMPQVAFFAAIAGSCLGFLLFNRHPAKIFMGDTGSLALGGVIAATAIWAKAELLLPIAGLIFVLEALSVIIQVTSYRLRSGKRVFKMAPLHHHFELSGWHETKVVARFTTFTVIICAALLAALVVRVYLAGGLSI